MTTINLITSKKVVSLKGASAAIQILGSSHNQQTRVAFLESSHTQLTRVALIQEALEMLLLKTRMLLFCTNQPMFKFKSKMMKKAMMTMFYRQNSQKQRSHPQLKTKSNRLHNSQLIWARLKNRMIMHKICKIQMSQQQRAVKLNKLLPYLSKIMRLKKMQLIQVRLKIKRRSKFQKSSNQNHRPLPNRPQIWLMRKNRKQKKNRRNKERSQPKRMVQKLKKNYKLKMPMIINWMSQSQLMRLFQ